MKDNIITMHLMKESTNLVLTDAYEFIPVGRLAFFQKWMWKMLRKMQALHSYYDKTTKIERIAFKEDDFVKRLIKAYGGCFPRTRPKHVYMGPDEFQELAYQKYDSLMSIGFNVHMNEGRTIFNLPITIVPHMNGVLII